MHLAAMMAFFALAVAPAWAARPAAAMSVSAAPGTLIDRQSIVGPPAGGTAWRVLYWSTDPDGAARQVSGLVIVPRGEAPVGGRPVVAWAHPTSGVVERCAPSRARLRYQMIAGLRSMLWRGYVVVATDYPGLGTPGPHPYLDGVSEARAVLDSVRAARAIPEAKASRRFAVWGHSQGGHAALFTGTIAKAYAPELSLAGVAVAAPATELGTLMNADLASQGGRNLTAMTLWAWSRLYGVPTAAVIRPAALPAVNHISSECLESPYDFLVRRRLGPKVPPDFLTSADFARQPPWSDFIARNTPGVLPPSIPVFIAQGDADGLVRPAITADYARRLCRAGSAVRYLLMPKVKHGLAGDRAAIPAIDWIANRLAGEPPPNDCGALPPP